jgi:hypothetical protein
MNETLNHIPNVLLLIAALVWAAENNIPLELPGESYNDSLTRIVSLYLGDDYTPDPTALPTAHLSHPDILNSGCSVLPAHFFFFNSFIASVSNSSSSRLKLSSPSLKRFLSTFTPTFLKISSGLMLPPSDKNSLIFSIYV